MKLNLLTRLNQNFIAKSLVALLAGGLITLSLEPFNIWPASFFAPLILWRLIHTTRPKQAAILGGLFGLGAFGSGTSWVFVSIYYHSATPLIIALVLTLAFTAVLAAFFALLAYLQQKFFVNARPLLSFPALWLLIELLRSWLFTGFPWLLLGTAQLTSPLAGWIPVIGVYGLSFLTVYCALAAYLLIKQQILIKQQALLSRLGLAASLVVILALGMGLKQIAWTQPTDQSLQVGLVQPNTPQADKWQPKQLFNILRNHLELTQQLGAVDLILWPETSIPLIAEEAESFFNLILQATNPAAGLISGLITYASASEYYNSLVTAGAASGSYSKVKLVPFGEYVPLESWVRGITDFFNLPMSGFSKGRQFPAQLTAKATQVAPLICYEVAYPNFSAKQAKTATWLLTVSNDAWFGKSLGPLQHLQLAKYRALESGKPLVRVTNNGISGVISAEGKLVESLPRFTAASASFTLNPRQGATPFSYLTSYPILVLSGFLLFLARKPTSKLEL